MQRADAAVRPNPGANTMSMPLVPARRSTTVRHVLMTADAVGGVWRYALDLAVALAARGVRTTLAVMGPPPDAAQRVEANQAGLTVVHRPYRLEWMDDPWEDVEQAGAWLLELERTLEPDVVHLNGYSHADLPWSAPVMVVAHSCVRSWWRAVKKAAAPVRLTRYEGAVRAGLAAARLVVAPTAAMLLALHDEYGVASCCRVIPNGTTSAALGVSPSSPSKEPIILAAGRLWDEAKNLDAVCGAAAAWPWPVYVVGDRHGPGDEVSRLQRVHALGRLEHRQLLEWQRRASIFVSPARYEPFGLSILEAAAAGCALVLGDIPSLRENWSGAAVFVPPDDVPALSRVVLGLINDTPRRRAMAGAAWERATRFTLARTAEQYLRAYKELLQ